MRESQRGQRKRKSPAKGEESTERQRAQRKPKSPTKAKDSNESQRGQRRAEAGRWLAGSAFPGAVATRPGQVAPQSKFGAFCTRLAQYNSNPHSPRASGCRLRHPEALGLCFLIGPRPPKHFAANAYKKNFPQAAARFPGRRGRHSQRASGCRVRPPFAVVPHSAQRVQQGNYKSGCRCCLTIELDWGAKRRT